jgi:hypothetical protein
MATQTDFDVADHGSVILLSPISGDAKDWVDDHLPDDAQWFAGGIAIERRYFPAIYEGILDDGLSIS